MESLINGPGTGTIKSSEKSYKITKRLQQSAMCWTSKIYAFTNCDIQNVQRCHDGNV